MASALAAAFRPIDDGAEIETCLSDMTTLLLVLVEFPRSLNGLVRPRNFAGAFVGNMRRRYANSNPLQEGGLLTDVLVLWYP